jgi:hypothetical protein
MKALLLLVCACLAVSSCGASRILGDSSETNGGYIGVTESLLSSIVVPLLQTEITNAYDNIHLQEIKINKGDIEFHALGFKFFDMDASSLNVALADDNEIHVSTNGASARAFFRFDGKILFIGFGGQCNPHITNLNIDARIQFGSNSNGKPTVNLAKFSLTLGNDGLGCTGLVGSIVDLIQDIFNNAITNAIEQAVNGAMQNIVDNTLNNDLQRLNLEFPITNGYAIADFSLTGAPSINTQRVRVDVAARIVPAADVNNISYPFPPPQPLTAACANRMVNLGLSAWSFETALYTYYIGKRLQQEWPNALGASTVALLLPGFVAQCGAAAKLNLGLAAAGPGNVSIGSSSLAAAMPLQLSLAGCNGTSFVLGATGALAVNVSIVNSQPSSVELLLGVAALALDDPRVISSNVGGGGSILAGLLEILNSVVASLVLPAVNEALAGSPIPLPSVDGFSFTNAIVTYASDSLCVGSDISVS